MVDMGKYPMWQPLRVLLIVCMNCRLQTGMQSCGATLRLSQLKTALHTYSLSGVTGQKKGTVSGT